LDQAHDLAVLVCDAHLPDTAGDLAATDQMAARAGVTVTGHCVIADPGRTARSLTTIGQWTGSAMWEDAVPVGRMTAEALLPGMSGAPVIRDGDGAVAGVVSGRYNSTDGWLAGTVWVTRTEDLAALLAGIAAVTMQQPPLAGPVDLLLTVTDGRVRLTGPGIKVAADHGGVRAGLAEAVNETRRSRARAGLPVRAQAETQPPAQDLSLGRAAQLLAESFLPEPGSQRAGKDTGCGGAGASAGAARAGRAAGVGRAAMGGPAQPGRPRPAGFAPAGQPVPEDASGSGAGVAGAAADRGRDRGPRRWGRAAAGL
jgi:hypothetical protein